MGWGLISPESGSVSPDNRMRVKKLFSRIAFSSTFEADRSIVFLELVLEKDYTSLPHSAHLADEGGTPIPSTPEYPSGCPSEIRSYSNEVPPSLGAQRDSVPLRLRADRTRLTDLLALPCRLPCRWNVCASWIGLNELRLLYCSAGSPAGGNYGQFSNFMLTSHAWQNCAVLEGGNTGQNCAVFEWGNADKKGVVFDWVSHMLNYTFFT